MSKNNHKGPGFFSGIFWGTLIGGVLGLLYAPEKGEETRKKLKEKKDDITEKGKKVADGAKIIAGEIKEISEPLVDELEKRIRPILEKAKDSGKEVQGELMEKIEQIITEVSGYKKKSKK